eukprot:1433453-Rhodomonas_salina.1
MSARNSHLDATKVCNRLPKRLEPVDLRPRDAEPVVPVCEVTSRLILVTSRLILVTSRLILVTSRRVLVTSHLILVTSHLVLVMPRSQRRIGVRTASGCTLSCPGSSL